ncbi:Carboxypeptidase Y precursor, putative [Perkinsus marinus ATCC 50983]|uniref:Carboxypeptidase Y, putative n=1 Tax=Perkinsus marinus (strain ATCC 50983 / TXsc) TaxID=423536 RepID=C5LUJ8_PERM5|nr:Carboxypeptidase Y precursor, putative [Perkinsus marinus ATCC 50983]EEQ99594.1 Carboxypeptidase Y precursor, putative [Perkinsus marinus ATCC 50983]|eukprot:XP_002766877.1 Carboxypeptidase Y precursor, putative [Perkinsus marinus ATCC 50983]
MGDMLWTRFFFWFFESRNDPATDPIFLWLEGGPGASGTASAVGYNGPCMVNKKGTAASNNPNSWTNKANGIWLDQPTGVGYSKGGPPEETIGETVKNIYSFLRAFFSRFPKYKGPFYLIGISFAGVLLPQIAHALKQGSEPPISLEGIIFQNAMINAEAQFPLYPEMAFHSKTAAPAITKQQYDQMKREMPGCLKEIQNCNRKPNVCRVAHEQCQELSLNPLVSNGVDFYKLTTKCPHPDRAGCNNEEDSPNVDSFMQLPDVKTFLGVSEEFVIDNDEVYNQLVPFVLLNSDSFLPGLLQSGVRVLTVAGDLDYICNFMGLKTWMLDLDWPGRDAFRSARDVEFKDSTGRVVGLRRSSSNHEYEFVQVYGAGHLAARDNPRGVMETINDFMNGL